MSHEVDSKLLQVEVKSLHVRIHPQEIVSCFVTVTTVTEYTWPQMASIAPTSQPMRMK